MGPPLPQPWWPRQVQQLARSCWTRLGDCWLWAAREDSLRLSSTSLTSWLVAEICSTKAKVFFRRSGNAVLD